MTSIRDPHLMTAEERDREVASLFAQALLRMRARPTPDDPARSRSPESGNSAAHGLELSGKPRLSGTRGYRYYVCINAQKRGWQKCPSRSVPAAEIERFVVDQIKAVARDPRLITETLIQARQHAEDALRTLQAERRSMERHLSTVNHEIGQVAIEAAGSDDEGPATRRLAELQERIQTGERRLTEIREQALHLQAHLIDEDEVAAALQESDPLWEALSPREPARILQLLIERVDYDGTDSTVSVTFRPTGIRNLVQEAAG